MAQRLAQAESLVKQDQWADASAAFVVAVRSLPAAHPLIPRAARGLAFALAQLTASAPPEDRIRARIQASEMVASSPHAQAVLYGDVGALYCEAGHFLVALDFLRRAVSLDPR